MSSRLKPHSMPLPQFWQMVQLLPGVIQSLWWQLNSWISAEGCPADWSHTACLCRNFGRWFSYYLGWSRVCGDSSTVESQLRDVQQIEATQHAFAAILADGSVITWGDPESVVTAQQLNLSWGMSSRLKPHSMPLPQFWQMVQLLPGVIQSLWWQLNSWISAEGCPADWSHTACLCRNFGRWFSYYLGWSRVWWWQLNSWISAEGCPADWSHTACLCRNFGRWFSYYLGWSRVCGDSSTVESQLRDVQQIEATQHAFAAILADGSVITWGDPESGGDSSTVESQLRDVQQIEATQHAFAAILADGSVITWGDPESGGDSSTVESQLRDVQQIEATQHAFAAILADGSVITWGDPESVVTAQQLNLSWGMSSRLKPHSMPLPQFWQMVQLLPGVIQSLVVTAQQLNLSWGMSSRLKPHSMPLPQFWQMVQLLPGVIQSLVVTAQQLNLSWGMSSRLKPHYYLGWSRVCGDSSTVESQLRDVQQIEATQHAFAAILADGSVITWGDPESGGDSSTVESQLRDVQQIEATQHAFAAILADGSVITWGDPESGGDSSTVESQLRDVQQIEATQHAFAAILADGSVITWGDPESVVTAQQLNLSWGMSSRLKPHSMPLPQFWQMVQLLPGVIQSLWWQLNSWISAEGCPADWSHTACLCRNFGRWFSYYLGWSRVWWWQLNSWISAEGCPADWSHTACLCRNFGRWFSYYLGWSRVWWWQLNSWISAEGCPADWSHTACLCRNFGRWFSYYLGWSRVWWWQLNSPRAASACITFPPGSVAFVAVCSFAELLSLFVDCTKMWCFDCFCLLEMWWEWHMQMQQKWSLAITQRPVIESLEKQSGARWVLRWFCWGDFVEYSVLFSKAHFPTRLWKQNIGDGTTAWQTAVRHLLQMSWLTATPHLLLDCGTGRSFQVWMTTFSIIFPDLQLSGRFFPAGPWEVVTSRASLGWTQSWCWTYRQTAGYLVLDILMPGGGKDVLNPVGILCLKKSRKNTEREREKEREKKRDQPTQRVLQFIIDWILHVRWCFNLVLSLKWMKLQILTKKSGYQSNVETLHELHADVFEMTCLTQNTWQKTVRNTWNTP